MAALPPCYPLPALTLLALWRLLLLREPVVAAGREQVAGVAKQWDQMWPAVYWIAAPRCLQLEVPLLAPVSQHCLQPEAPLLAAVRQHCLQPEAALLAPVSQHCLQPEVTLLAPVWQHCLQTEVLWEHRLACPPLPLRVRHHGSQSHLQSR